MRETDRFPPCAPVQLTVVENLATQLCPIPAVLTVGRRRQAIKRKPGQLITRLRVGSAQSARPRRLCAETAASALALTVWVFLCAHGGVEELLEFERAQFALLDLDVRSELHQLLLLSLYLFLAVQFLLF